MTDSRIARPDMPDMQDCLIVGGGPAGLTAALYLARFLRRVTVIDAQQGRARMIPRTHNLGPFPGGISGPELLARMRCHAERYGASIQTGTVHSVDRHTDGFCITTDRQTITARSVILATGVFNHRPPLSVEDHDRGLARGLIRYCPVCDAHEVRGQRIAVLGNDTHGFAEALFLRQFSGSVTLIPPDGTRAAAADGVDGLAAPMSGLALSENAVLVTLTNGEIRHFDTLYVALGTTPCADLAVRLGVEITSGGSCIVDAKQKTGIDRVYAIGDVTDRLDQIGVAIGQGAVAATTLHNDLQ